MFLRPRKPRASALENLKLKNDPVCVLPFNQVCKKSLVVGDVSLKHITQNATSKTINTCILKSTKPGHRSEMCYSTLPETRY